MLTIHHLRIGRSIFTVWLLEELELEYTVKEYFRNPDTNRAPPELRDIHPLGKSPVIDDDGLILTESGAIVSYLLKKHDPEHRFSPAPHDLAAWGTYNQWLHYPEGSVFLALLIQLLLLRSGVPAPVFEGYSQAEVKLHLDHISSQLGENDYILGNQFSAADFGVCYMMSMAESLGLLSGHKSLSDYVERNKNRPAFKRAVDRAVE
ncbi:Glutathione S-transferase [marine gamma proteobacterium HTCC2143]|jgi:glutathione S-transferase|uniref:Glutathione S-transferase n=1 Tax=marine gamma proteobacterium HTCC2143 TaxID=247633 RepID=A0YAE1_9GAMM|nr:Glutathione S-transferase [marine gamma proteobacterium HTCC2143]